MSLCFTLNCTENEVQLGKSQKKTIREYVDLLLVNEKYFDAGGNFSQEELVKNNGNVFSVVIKSISDSYSSHENETFEVIECFLNIEKANELYEIVSLYNKLNDDLMFNDEKSKETVADSFIDELKNKYGIIKEKEYKQVGNRKFLTEDFSNKVEYKDEQGELKYFMIDWFSFGTNFADMFVLNKRVLNCEVQLNSESKSKIKYRSM